MDGLFLYKGLMVATFLAALLALALGVGSMGNHNSTASNRFMYWRVGLCGALLIEILLFVFVLRP